MKYLTPAAMAAITGGELNCPADKMNTEITGITSDSRKVAPGNLFVPFKGASFDAHDFIPGVMEKGALITLTEREDTSADYPFIRVASSLKALQKITAYYLKEMDVPVVSITGSVGKTSTKEMVASVLAQKYKTLKTLGNFNNELGLPLTIARLTDEDEVAVLEMGISHFGDMTELGEIAAPDISVITNIGTCHLENLIDRDGVFKAKTEIFDFLKPGGRVVLNGDDDKLCAVDTVNGMKPVFFGLDSRCDFWADEVRSLGIKGMTCTIHTPEEAFGVTVPIPGLHSVSNALCACAVGHLLGVSPEEMKRGIEEVETLAGRFRLIDHKGMTIVDDCYNANPMSMKASLGVLHETEGRTVAILGDMGELGTNEEALHREVGTYAVSHRPNLLLTVGPLARQIAEAAAEGCGAAVETGADAGESLVDGADSKDRIIAFPDNAALLKVLPKLVAAGDTILVKASHFMNFTEIVNALASL
ncbi:MAG: UDP-N-acetylmuramoyl-tripeptide--D-alanyl-D-alanine ligase [Lachnospiraceae bacterium]|nr:UDP-N-acetylmuramoyl-tripeptide--D-alanyl-D-alanine ligase [Lachnospiraceae bacterium]